MLGGHVVCSRSVDRSIITQWTEKPQETICLVEAVHTIVGTKKMGGVQQLGKRHENLYNVTILYGSPVLET